jgi:hypothetical protein
MASFRLNYPGDPGGAHSRSIQFEAADAGAALSIAFPYARERAAELWCDDKMLCRIECPSDAGGFWLIS